MATKTVTAVPSGKIYIQSSYNNTLMTFTDERGNVLVSASGGRLGFKGPKKSTAYAGGLVAKELLQRMAPYAVQSLAVFVRGVGGGREASLRALNVPGVTITSVKDITPIPHNGCRPPKPRRI